MSTTTTMMGLKVPQMGDPSPGYVSDLSTTINTLDAHDHSVGNGTKVTQAGLNISGALPLNGNSLTTARSAQFTPQTSALSSPSDNGSLFIYNGDLYYLNGSNQLVRISSGSTLTGGIGGDYALYYPTAQISYINSDLAYYFKDSTGSAAKLQPLSVALGSSLGNSGTISYTGTSSRNFNFTDTSGGGNTILNAGGASLGTSGLTTTGGVSASGLVSGGSASISGNAAVGSLNATGGVLQGSRIIALRGVVKASAAAGTTSNPITAYVDGATAAFGQTTFTPPYAGSVAALTARAYGAVGTAGSVILQTSGLSTNATSASFAFGTLTNGGASTFTPGTFTFTAGTGFTVNVNTSGWAQSTTGTTGIDVTMWVYC